MLKLLVSPWSDVRMSKKEKVYKVIFLNQGKVYELFASDVHQSAMYAFIEVESLRFGEKTSVVVDPSEENLKTEFDGVKRIYIPIHSVIRIDEVEKEGHAKITDASGDNVSPFPIYPPAGSTKT